MTTGTGWFTDLFGFTDVNESANEVKFKESNAKFAYNPKTGILSSKVVPDMSWKAGHFKNPSLAALRKQTSDEMKRMTDNPTQTTVTLVSGDVAILHGTLDYDGAVFRRMRN